MKAYPLRGTIVLLITISFIFWQCHSRPSQTVVVYVSEDRVFSEPILQDFEKTTGIQVQAVYDTEEAKSTGVMNRLIAEKEHPQADVYWANEPIRAEVLKQKGIAAPYVSPNASGIPATFKDPDGYWTGFSARARVFIVNQNVTAPPTSIQAYIQPRWRGRGVIANPLFGTTTSHLAALATLWGIDSTMAFLKRLRENQIAISTSNGESADLVAAGQYDFSLVDSDDAINRQRQGKPVRLVYPDQGPQEPGCFIVPNAVVLINGAPHPKTARKLIDFLLSRETEQKLAFADCAQIPLHTGVPMPKELKPIDSLKVMPVDYGQVAQMLLKMQPLLKEWVGL